MSTLTSLSFNVAGHVAGRWGVARDRVHAYLLAAGLDEGAAETLSREVSARCAHSLDVDSTEEAIHVALEAARAELWGQTGSSESPSAGEPTKQLPLEIRSQQLGSVIDWRRAAWRLRRLVVPTNLERQRDDNAVRAADLSRQARLRRLCFTVLILSTAIWGTNTFLKVLSTDGLSILDIAHVAVFAVLMLWLSQSFWTLTAGTFVMLRRIWHRRRAPTVHVTALPAGQRVALTMPVYNEDPQRVFAGLRAMWADLAESGPQAARFDLFILSDTTDPDLWLAEIDAWQSLRQGLPGGERIYYRRRIKNLRRKSGNIEDFLSRWGSGYAYMLVLDADSLMSAHSMVALVERMDANPHVGLIQAPPKLVRGRSLFARVLQFAGELYGPLSAAGISYWAMGEGNYWGHNAIIRIAPWVKLCGLPLLPGRAPLGGEILSHDFVEAALMRRGGWQVWIADDLNESYEEPPPGIEEFATRDRRWCQGNLQHVRVLFGGKLHWVSRLHLAIGVLSYVTSPLWLLFLLLSAAQAWELTYGRPVYFIDGWPFPMLPVAVGSDATLLLVVTLGLLFVPKLMGIGVALIDGRRRRPLGGTLRIIASALIETLFSALLAPIMMLMHTRFVASILLGSAIEWHPQKRQAGGSGLSAAARAFGWASILGVVATVAAGFATPILLLWLIPVVAGLWLAIPLVLVSSREDVGQWLQKHGLLLVREERAPPPVLSRLEKLLGPLQSEEDKKARFVRTVMDPRLHALHVDLLERRDGEASSPAPPLLERKAVYLGPAALDKLERRALLENIPMMRRLHLAAWVHWPAQGISL